MGLLTTLLNSANALSVFDREFGTIQNNIANQNTPGFAAQNLTLVADSFDSNQLTGGVSAGPLASTRSQFLEQAVRSQTTLLGSAEQQSADLAPLQSIFDLTSTTGVSGSMNAFFNSFSQLSVNPNDPVARQNVLTQSQKVAVSFNQAAGSIQTVSNNVSVETGNTVGAINKIAADLASINKHYAVTPGAASDSGLDAQVNSDLENLSELTNYTVLHTDGQINVYLGGQTPLVLGSQAMQVTADFSTPKAILRDSQGNDFTSQITSGNLGAQLQEHNTIIPGYQASLNTLAQNFADTANTALSQGLDQNGNTPANNLFTYNTATDAAFSLSVTSGFTTDQIAAASVTAPGGNGNAQSIAQMISAPNAAGFTFAQAFGNLGQAVGSDISNATQNQSEAQDLVTQAQAQRAAVSGVNLNSEAAKLLEFQQAFQGVAKVVSVLNSLSQTLIQMVS